MILGFPRRSVTVATLAVVGVLVVASCGSGSSSSVLPIEPDDEPETSSQDSASTSPAPAGLATELGPDDEGLLISVDRVSDGDSVRATSPEGNLEIRLLGINAPERDECFGAASKDELARLLDNAEVTLHPWPGERDEFGRELGFLVADGVFVNLSLVESGHVVARDQSDHGFGNEFETAEAAASNSELGLWAADACGEPTDAELRIVDVEEDAPGDDRANPNGEFALFRNDDTAPASLDGWSLRDESTRHRYDFPPIEIPAETEFLVRTGCGTNDLDSRPIELFWCDPEPPVWNNSGDTAFLLDPNGAIADKLVIRG